MVALSQLKLLISLARIDGEVADKERTYINNIAKANGLVDVEKLFEETHELIIPQDLTPDQKFEYLFSLVQLMKIDERLYKDEIRFCAKVASRLGYPLEVLVDLMLNVKAATTMATDEIDALKNLITEHLNEE